MLTNKELGDAPLPYKGMNIKLEIASRVIGSVIDRSKYGLEDLTKPRIVEEIIKATNFITEKLIETLNK